ncbi:hypothetical protein INT44_000647 [Umbelopsis vinacea]|uniref:DUF1446-domain-containing protein n=1 Tax=Umbelopsis vinacea TaxID=44442 RepID=A0A8H7UN66_9FUNG|nr:hypothetical protein INT44_000647 [Umbelopsis vinacea]
MADSGAKPVRIGCYSAFWGDSAAAALQLVEQEGSNLDYLVADYLAEVTMGILARRRKRSTKLGGSGAGGYVAEFITLVLNRILPQIMENETKVITNAGGLDPMACKAAIEAALTKAGIPLDQCKVAAVYGDDLISDTKTTLAHHPEAQAFSATSDPKDSDAQPKPDTPLSSLNAYLGANAIAKALDDGAKIVVTGRVVDSALVVGPLMHEYGWKSSQSNYYDLLASASLAGHIIECGCQATGGNFTDWQLAANSEHGGYANMGYPIVEFHKNGQFVVTKPKLTGGLVSVATVAEQMLYEILDPGAYLLPDVILDMRGVELKQLEKNRVLVTGAKGRKPTKYLKCSGVWVDGHKISGELMIGGEDAREKALAVGNAIITRARTLLQTFGLEDFRGTNIETLGAEGTYGPHSTMTKSREVILRLTIHHDNPMALRLFGMEVAPSATCMAPGITGAGAGRPAPMSNLVHFSCLIPKNDVPTFVCTGENGKVEKVEWEAWDESKNYATPPSLVPYDNTVPETKNLQKVRLIKLANGRSGDKGDVCNVGIIARDPQYLPYIKKALTEEVVFKYMQHLCQGSVTRYELPGAHALNFVLTKSLGGGGLSSLRIDRQGKTYAQMVLSGIDVEIPANLLKTDSKL